MRWLQRPLIAAATLACMLAAPPIAAKPAPVPKLVTETAKPVVVHGTPLHALADCELGVGLVGGVYLLDGYIQPPEDQYYTLIDPGECATCSDTVLIAAAHIVLLLTTGCTRQPIDVSIVGVSPDDSACPKPDPSNVILPAAPYVLDYGTSGLLDFEIPLPASVCITGRVFLGFTFQEVECYSPLVVQEGGSAPCKSWNFYGSSEDDLGIVLPKLSPVLGLPVHYAEALCASCASTPALPSSWGSLKIRYANP